MKTAISIPDNLFKKIDDLAAELHLSRSRLFAVAVRDYMERHNNKKMLGALNKTYSEDESEEEKALRRESKRHYAESLKAEKW